MRVIISEEIKQVVILDISGFYAQIHNQGYFDSKTVEEIREEYSDRKHWKILFLE